MMNGEFTQILAAILAGLLVWAAVVDLRTRTIPDWVSIAVVAMAPLFWWAESVAFYPDADPTLHGTAQLAFQQSSLAARNVKAFLNNKELQSKHFEELGEAISLGTERAAVLTGGKAFGGALARQARFALYTSRLPTWHHRLRVGASWFFEGTAPRPLLPLGLER